MAIEYHCPLSLNVTSSLIIWMQGGGLPCIEMQTHMYSDIKCNVAAHESLKMMMKVVIEDVETQETCQRVCKKLMESFYKGTKLEKEPAALK